MTSIAKTALQLFSTVTEGGHVELSLQEVPVPQPKADEVLVRIEATPINPSDLGLMFGPADMSKLTRIGNVVSASIHPGMQADAAKRTGLRLPTGNEGAGTVVGAGESAPAQALLGRRVSLAGGQMHAQYRCMKAADCLPLPEGTSTEAGASSWVNPMTALGMIGTMRRDGFSALIHTAAASNLGRMLVRLCRHESVPLVNVVRSEEQAALLRREGAVHVLNQSEPDFVARLADAVEATGAFIGFDAVGGGQLADQLLAGMEMAAVRRNPAFSRYGTSQRKQVYIYGRLNVGSTEFSRDYGFAWSAGGWLLTSYLTSLEAKELARLRRFVGDHLNDIFASSYTARITLDQVLDPEMIKRYARLATGEKYLITP